MSQIFHYLADYSGFVVTVDYGAADQTSYQPEAIVNLESPAYHDLARIAKDVAAGAVLIAAITAGIIGICLFLHFPKLTETLPTIVTTPWLLAVFVVLLVGGILFAFQGNRLFRK